MGLISYGVELLWCWISVWLYFLLCCIVLGFSWEGLHCCGAAFSRGWLSAGLNYCGVGLLRGLMLCCLINLGLIVCGVECLWDWIFVGVDVLRGFDFVGFDYCGVACLWGWTFAGSYFFGVLFPWDLIFVMLNSCGVQFLWGCVIAGFAFCGVWLCGVCFLCGCIFFGVAFSVLNCCGVHFCGVELLRGWIYVVF